MRITTGIILVSLVTAATCRGAGSDATVRRYVRRGDAYFKAYQFDLAAHAYKMALMHDPESEVAWSRHRQAVERTRIIDRYMGTARDLTQEGRFEEAAEYLRRAVKMNPRNREIWNAYETVLARNPTAVHILTEQDAWDAYREAKTRFEEGDHLSAERLLERIHGFTDDPTLKYYARSYLQKVQLKMKELRPSSHIHVTDK